MPQKRSLIIFIIISLVLIGVGFSLGLGYGYKIKGEEVAKFISSKIIGAEEISARGEVTKISDRALTLTAEGETLAIPIKDEAEIFLQVVSEEKLEEELEEGEEKEGEGQVITSKSVGFDEIKIGDFVDVFLGLGEKGFEGEKVTILLRK